MKKIRLLSLPLSAIQALTVILALVPANYLQSAAPRKPFYEHEVCAQEIACPTCTFLNKPGSAACELCATPLPALHAPKINEKEQEERRRAQEQEDATYEALALTYQQQLALQKRAAAPKYALQSAHDALRDDHTAAPAPAHVRYNARNWFSIPVAQRILFYDDKAHPAYFAFSNYYPHRKPLSINDFWYSFDGKNDARNQWGTAEQYFQAMKFPLDAPSARGKRIENTPNYKLRELIRNNGMPAADESKQLVKKQRDKHFLGTEWVDDLEGKNSWNNDYAPAAMLAVVRAKFAQDPVAQQLLLSTGDAVLIEDTYKYGDAIWGAGKDGMGQNLLGQILMHVRKEIRDGEKHEFVAQTPAAFVQK